jgi:hypothetical protein
MNFWSWVALFIGLALAEALEVPIRMWVGLCAALFLLELEQRYAALKKETDERNTAIQSALERIEQRLTETRT